MARLIILICSLLLSASSSVTAARPDVQTASDPLSMNFGGTSDRPHSYCRVDLNGDGLEDIIVTGPHSWAGTGGNVHFIFLRQPDGNYKQGKDTITANSLALEQHGGRTFLWCYSRSSSQSGTIWYYSIDTPGNLLASSRLGIRTGDGGSDLGNRVYQAIFNETALLRFQENR